MHRDHHAGVEEVFLCFALAVLTLSRETTAPTKSPEAINAIRASVAAESS